MKTKLRLLPHWCQITDYRLHAIEKGKFNPSTILALKISELFDKNVNEIFTLEETD